MIVLRDTEACFCFFLGWQQCTSVKYEQFQHLLLHVFFFLHERIFSPKTVKMEKNVMFTKEDVSVFSFILSGLTQV